MIKMSNGTSTIEIPAGAENVYSSVGFERVDGETIVESSGVENVESLTDDKSQLASALIDEGSNEDEFEDDDSEVEDDTSEEDASDDAFIDEVELKPISHWKKEEIVRYSKLKCIDISCTKNAGEAKAVVKAAIEAAG